MHKGQHQQHTVTHEQQIFEPWFLKLPSSQESRDTPAFTSKLACITVLKTYEKYMPKSVGASAHPCLTLFLIGKASDKWSSN